MVQGSFLEFGITVEQLWQAALSPPPNVSGGTLILQGGVSTPGLSPPFEGPLQGAESISAMGLSHLDPSHDTG